MRAKETINKKNNFILFGLILILTASVSYAIDDLMGFEANAVDINGDPIQSANLFIEIWDSSAGGTLIYNSTDDYLGNVSSGKIDITIGNGIQSLNLEYGRNYYMEVWIDNDELDFDNNERLRFQSSIGNITNSRISPDNITNDLIQENIQLRGNISITENLTSKLLSVLTSSVFNDQAGDNDFLIKGDTDNNLFFVDSSADAVGISTSTPSAGDKLNIIGNLNVTGSIFAGGSQIGSGANVSGGGTDGRLVKFTGQSSIGDSIITELLSSYIGIDSLNPAAIFEVRSSSAGLLEVNLSGALYINTTSGGIGINTDNPTHTLTVVGDLNVTGDSFLNNINISGVTFSEGKITAQVDDSSNDTSTEIINLIHTTNNALNGTDGIGSSLLFAAEDSLQQIENLTEIKGFLTTATSGNEASILTFSTRTAGGALTEKLRIDDIGNIGINTTTPANTLNIIGDLNVTGSSYLGSFTIQDELTIGNNNISSTYVGIGTNTPSQTLTVVGDLNVYDGDVNFSTATIDGLYYRNLTGQLHLGQLVSTSDALFYLNNTGLRVALDIKQSIVSESVSIFNHETATTGNTIGIIDARAGGTTRFIVTTGGNVGIGTTSPTALLDIAGAGVLDFNVSGILHANSSQVVIGDPLTPLKGNTVNKLIIDGSILLANQSSDNLGSIQGMDNQGNVDELIGWNTGTTQDLIVANSANIDNIVIGIGTAQKVGIGILSPDSASKLNIEGGTNNPVILLNNTNYLGVENTTGSNIRLIGMDSNNDIYIGAIDIQVAVTFY